MIAGWGIAVDRVISDFVTGASEQLVLRAPPGNEVLLVEGQGSIFHPAYAPVTFGLLYGCAPDALLLCHRPNTTHIDGFQNKIPSLSTLVEAHEMLLRHVKPARVAAIVLDTSALSDAAGSRRHHASRTRNRPPRRRPSPQHRHKNLARNRHRVATHPKRQRRPPIVILAASHYNCHPELSKDPEAPRGQRIRARRAPQR